MVIIKYEKQSIIIVPLFNELIPGAEPLHPLQLPSGGGGDAAVLLEQVQVRRDGRSEGGRGTGRLVPQRRLDQAA